MAKAVTRIVQVRDGIIGPDEPRECHVTIKILSAYPEVSQAHLEVAKKLSNPLLMGPPICDEFIAFVEHVFTEEEANVVRHLGMSKKSLPDIARSAGLPLDQVTEVLLRLSTERPSVTRSVEKGKERYSLMPVFPGIYEMVLIGKDPGTLTDWHRRFSDLFEKLYMTGYWIDGQREGGTAFVRYLPVEESIAANPMALPTDKLAEVLEPYDLFGVGQCQCRMTEIMKGGGCGKPLSNCLIVGKMAETGIRDGWLKKVSRQDALEIKREAESHGLVNWMMNAVEASSQSSCSCCGCCCHNFRMISEFGAPGAIAPPHFLPSADASACNYCGKCALACPMAALIIDTRGKSRKHLLHRCIGCGLCVLACDKTKAASMVAVDDYKGPAKSLNRLIASSMPHTLAWSFKSWRQRRRA